MPGATATAVMNWTSGGQPYTWTVTAQTGESDDDYADRCKREFKAKLHDHPRD
jgi:hypothetical protein